MVTVLYAFCVLISTASVHMLSYTSNELKACVVYNQPSVSALHSIRALGLNSVRRYRGRRAGRRCIKFHLDLVGNGAYVFSDYLRPRPSPRSLSSRDTVLRRVRCLHVPSTGGDELAFGFLNIRSLTHKLDSLREVSTELGIGVLCLCETWHDPDSAWIGRLRLDGWNVVEKARPRPFETSCSTFTNHGGVAICVSPGIRLVNVDIPVTVTTFEYVCARASSMTSCLLVVIYRPGSSAVTPLFFQELMTLLSVLAPLCDPVYIVGDFNVRFDRDNDPARHQLCDLFTSYNFVRSVTGPTQQYGGVLDVLASSRAVPMPCVSVHDVGLSDHHLLKWNVALSRPRPIYATVSRRMWGKLDLPAFRKGLQLSSLADVSSWSDLDAESMAHLFNREVTRLLDKFIPVRTVSVRRRSSDPWFDGECRTAKMMLRKAERRARRASPAEVAASTAEWTKQRSAYRRLISRKREVFWSCKIERERASPRRLWQSIDALMGRGRVPLPERLTADDFSAFFSNKVSAVLTATSECEPPGFTPAPSGCSLGGFRALSVDEVSSELRALPDKCCASDPLPPRLLRECADILSPFVTELINRSLLSGEFPQSLKAAFVTPRIKKSGLDASDVSSYRPISNLSVLSKLLERFVSKQLTDHLAVFGLLPELQSAYRAFHSTETAVLKITSDILRELDQGKVALLVLLDLTAAFDTVDHSILLRRLNISYGINHVALRWFSSYLDHRTQFVRCPHSRTSPSRVTCGVPQGSVLGPILFSLYVADLIRIILKHGLQGHLYADDTQIYSGCWPSETHLLLERLTRCLDELSVWLKSNRLQLNVSKSEVLWLATERQQHLLPRDCIRIHDLGLHPVTSVRNLGIHLDSAVTLKLHVAKTVASCFSSLRLIRSLRRSVSQSVLKTLVVALVLTKLDYGNAVLAGTPAYSLDRLQSVMHCAARLIHSSARYDHVTPLLIDLHWLSVPERIMFKLSTLVYRCLNGMGPQYLASEFHRVSDLTGRKRLRSSTTSLLIVPRTRLVSVGDRAFPVAAARAWNSLPADIRESSSLDVFKSRLKSWLFKTSYLANSV